MEDSSKNDSRDATPVPTKLVKEPTAAGNPLYGCAILLIAIATFGFIIGWTLYSGWKQNAEINTFTTTDAASLDPIRVDEAQKTAVRTKLDAFALMANNGKPVTLTLSLEELNTILVVAGEAGVADYRDMVRFTGLDGASQMFKADIRWRMNNLPFVKAPDRYLVGSATFKPVIKNDSLEIHIETLDVPGKTVSAGFLRQLQNWPWLNLAKLKEEVKKPLSKATRFEFRPDGSLFILHAGEIPPQ